MAARVEQRLGVAGDGGLGFFDVGGGLTLVELRDRLLEDLRVTHEVVPDDAFDLALLRGREFLPRSRQRQHQQRTRNCSG